MEREDLASWLRLALTPGIGNTAARQLMAAFGPPSNIFSASAAALRDIAGAGLATSIAQEPPEFPAQLRVTLDWLDHEQGNVPRRVLNLADPDYPPSLLQTEDPPLMLYLLGRGQLPWPAAVAVVGSRNPTPQGQINAREFGRSLAQAGLTVVSGLALGVDGAAHEGALDGAAAGQLATIAVVGTGLDSVYPKQHEGLAERIAERGLIVSEYPLGTAPLSANFPRRNRIISGLSEGTLVVEAALRSGSLITARMANEQGKDVFAIPGSIHSPQSRGCHQLLRQGAKLVESAQDILEELRPGVATAAQASRARPSVPTGAPGRLLDALGYDPVGLDALVARTGISTADLQAQLLELELSGHVSRLPGGMFQRTASV